MSVVDPKQEPKEVVSTRRARGAPRIRAPLALGGGLVLGVDFYPGTETIAAFYRFEMWDQDVKVRETLFQSDVDRAAEAGMLASTIINLMTTMFAKVQAERMLLHDTPVLIARAMDQVKALT